jgi:hypothetical protein
MGKAQTGGIPGHRCCCALRWDLRPRALGVFSVFGYFYFKYQGIVDERLKQPIFANTAKIFAAPREVRPGKSSPSA